MNHTALAEALRENGLRATSQRIAVYEYLLEHRTHPGVEEIYEGLSGQYPGLSKTTVYNILQSLCEKGLTLSLSIDTRETRFDGYVHAHGHFRCEGCARVTDFSLEKLECSGLEGFSILKKDVYFSGLCPDCIAKNKK